MTLFSYCVIAAITVCYGGVFIRLRHFPARDAATLRLAAAGIHLVFCLLFCALYLIVGLGDKSVAIVAGIAAALVIIVTMWAARPLLVIDEGDPRFGCERYRDERLQRH